MSGGSSSSNSPEGDMPDMPAAPDLAGEMPADFPDDADIAGEPMPSDDGFDATPVVPGEKPKVAGNWTCAGCGGAITSLPFLPRDTSNLKCLDCFKASKG
jgi:CxxC-x17-CxxC domain-containing protein